MDLNEHFLQISIKNCVISTGVQVKPIRLEFPGLPPVAHRSLSSYQIMAVSTRIYSPASLRRGSWSVFVLLHYSRLGAAIRLHLLLLSRLTHFGFPQTRSQNIKKWLKSGEVFSWSSVLICHSLSGAFPLSYESLFSKMTLLDCFEDLIEFWLVTSVCSLCL